MLTFQLVEGKGKEHNLERTGRSVAVGSLYSTPIVVFLYNFVDQVHRVVLINDFTWNCLKFSLYVHMLAV